MGTTEVLVAPLSQLVTLLSLRPWLCLINMHSHRFTTLKPLLLLRPPSLCMWMWTWHE